MARIRLENNTAIPMPVVLVGTTVEGKANFMAVGWVSRVNYQPPMIAVGINRNHHTAEGIRENKTFSVCLPGSQLVKETDYCGLVSGKTVDKSKLFTVFYGELPGAPMIEECPVCMECRLVDQLDLPTNTFFVGEITGAYGEEQYLSEGRPDYKKIDPFFLTMPDNTYWSVGAPAGKAWSIGNALKNK